MRTKLLAAILLTVIAAFPAAAQTAPDVAPHTQLSAHPVSQLLGEWRGKGWMMQRDGSRIEYEALERVRWNLAGTALIVEGLGRHHDQETGEITIGHDAFALMTWDDESNSPRLSAKRAGEPFQTHEITADPGSGALIWHVIPSRVRFTITIKDGVWTEIGEFSQDGGENWMKFLEMKLQQRL